MMVLSLLFGKKYPSPKIGSIDLDVTIREEHRFASRVTNYPVEDGTIISDHIINEPDIVVLVGLVTDTPLSLFAPFNRSIDAFNRLIQLHQNRDVITVVTGLKVYKNMAITTLDVPRDVRTGQSLTFTIELQRIVFDTSVRLL
ncbi:MAG: phage baseplate protein, partial [Rhabdochlamydiaceae bacterium]